MLSVQAPGNDQVLETSLFNSHMLMSLKAVMVERL